MKNAIITAAVIATITACGALGQMPDVQGGSLGGGLRIKNITYNAPLELTAANITTADPYTIDKPPIVGFVPYIAISLTNKRLEDLEYNAEKELNYSGTSLVSTPSANYIIGIFDTGASSHVFGYAASQALGLKGSYITSNIMTIGGVSGFADTWVSKPVGVFFEGLRAIDAQSGLLNTSLLVGQSNVAVLSGMSPAAGEPDLPVVVGCPMSVFYDVAVDNDNQITVIKNGRRYKSPSLSVYDFYDEQCPSYQNILPLELRPLGAISVTYTPGVDGVFEFNFDPASPSVITGTGSQSLYFVAAVDMYHNGKQAFDKDRFMFDTGAQSTIIGSRVAARLGLNPDYADFEIQAMGVNGEIVDLPGFIIERIEIPVLGNWLTFTNVPVALLDVASPEGGTLDGIIGTNLFNNFNLVLRGGGMMLTDDPYIEFEPRQVPFVAGDIWPQNPDGFVDYNDVIAFSEYWLMDAQDLMWNQDADIAPWPVPDGIINMDDFAAMAAAAAK